MSTTTDIPKASDQAAGASQPDRKRIAFRKLLSWLVVVLVVAFGIYWFKFRPTPVTAHAVATGEVRSEVMGTGTLEARVKTTISPRIQERLSTIIMTLILYTLTLDKIHDIALLKLMGARNTMIVGLILQQAQLLGRCLRSVL